MTDSDFSAFLLNTEQHRDLMVKTIASSLSAMTDQTVSAYKVICDESNNGEASIARNELHVKIEMPFPGHLYHIEPGWIAVTKWGRQVGGYYETMNDAKQAVMDALYDGSFHDGKYIEVYTDLQGAISHPLPTEAIDIEFTGVWADADKPELVTWGVVKYELDGSSSGV